LFKSIGVEEEGAGFHFLISMVSLSVFPFMASTITKAIRPDIYASDAEFVEARKIQVKQTLKKSYK